MRGERWTDVCSQPFGTEHIGTDINLEDRTITYRYKVKWWYLFVIAARTTKSIFKEGVCLHVLQRITADNTEWDREIH